MADIVKVLDTGLAMITGLLAGVASIPTHIAWGTGLTAPTATDVGLEVESAEESRALATVSQQTTAVTNDTFRAVATITCATSAKSISEAGIFDQATGGNCFVRATFDALPLSVGDSISFTFNNVIEEKV